MTNRKILIDCGTHLGMGFSKLAAAFDVDQGWETFGFEANPFVFDAYVKNIESEKYPILTDKNLKLENKAVWIHNDGIEGSEYQVLPKMIEDGSIGYINHAFIEWHDWVMPEYSSKTSELMNALRESNVQLGGWV